MRFRHENNKEKSAVQALEAEWNLDSNVMYSYADFTDTWAISNSNTYSWESCAVSGTGQYGLATTLDVAGKFSCSICVYTQYRTHSNMFLILVHMGIRYRNYA